jgi:hypothetical protein
VAKATRSSPARALQPPSPTTTSGRCASASSRPARARRRERAREDLGQARGVVGLGDPLRHRAEDAPVVELLECLAADRRAGYLADEQEHRRRVLEGGRDTDRGVHRARRSRDQADPRAPGELAGGLGHVRRRRLVARGDEAHRAVVERVEDREVALARNPECDARAVERELIDEDPAAAARHRRTGSSRKIVARWVFGLSASAGST